MKKKLLFGILVVISLFLMVGCGSSTKTDELSEIKKPSKKELQNGTYYLEKVKSYGTTEDRDKYIQENGMDLTFDIQDGKATLKVDYTDDTKNDVEYVYTYADGQMTDENGQVYYSYVYDGKNTVEVKDVYNVATYIYTFVRK